MEFIGWLLLSSVVLLAFMAVSAIYAEYMGWIRFEHMPVVNCFQAELGTPDYEQEGNVLRFKAPNTIMLEAAGGLEVIDVGYYVKIPDGYCGVMVLHHENFVDRYERPHKMVATGATVLPPEYQGTVKIEVWNRHLEEPAAVSKGSDLLDLYLVSTPAQIKVDDVL